MSGNDKYPVRAWENLSSPIQMELSLKRKSFSVFLVPFLGSTSNFKHFEKKKMIAITTLFRKLQNVKNLVRLVSKRHRFRTPFDSQHVKGSPTLVRSAWENFHHIFSSLHETLIMKIYSLVIYQILGAFRNTSTANHTYPVRDCENLLSPIQMQFSLKPKTFSHCFVPFSKPTSNLKPF